MNEPEPIPAALRDATTTAVLQIDQAREEITARLLDIYREQGNLEGFFRGINRVLMSLMEAADDYLAQHPDQSEDLRPALYSFVEHLDHRIRRLTNEHGFVEGGLGI
ncbi:MAG: hypothetical protein ACM359_03870 [Bacillota bacterium]